VFPWRESVFRVDFRDRQVSRVFQASGEHSVLGTWALRPTESRGSDSTRVAIVTNDRLYIVDAKGTTVREVPVDLPNVRYGHVRIPVGKPEGPFQLRCPQPGTAGGDIVTELAPDGSVLRSVQLPPTEIETRPSPPSFRERFQRVSTWALLGTPMPALGATATPPLKRSFFEGPSGLWGLALGALLSAAATLLLTRRYAFSRGRCLLWTVANALLGIAGLLVLWSLAEWPARETCPSCARKRIVTREGCEHCGASFPPPPRDGTEIREAVCSGFVE
jgi:hypothetical protein